MSSSKATNPTPEVGSTSVIAVAIKEARERAGLSQEVVARAMGWNSPETLSAIEREARQVKAFELSKLSKILSIGLDVLLGVQPLPKKALVLWRTSTGKPHADPNKRKQREAALTDRARRYALVAEWANEPPCRALPQFPLNPNSASKFEVESMGQRLSEWLKLGARPAMTLLEILEETYGVKVFYEHLEGDGDGSAASTMGDFGAAVLLCSTEPQWRRAFSLAHELFHLITWNAIEEIWSKDCVDGCPAWYEQLEYLANNFASALLLPEAEVRDCVEARAKEKSLTALDLVQMAFDFTVSLDTLAIGLHRLRIVDADGKKALCDRNGVYHQTWLAASHSRREPVEGVFTERYKGLVRAAYERGEIGRSKAAECLEVPLGELSVLGFDKQFDDSASLTVA